MILMIFLLIRGFYLHFTPAESKSLKQIATSQYQRNISLSPYRGSIFDHRREPLAISIKKPSLYINPKIFSPSQQQLKKIAHTLKISRKKLALSANRKNYFAWIKRKISRTQRDIIMKMKLRGLYQILEPDRYYPLSSSIAQLIGWVGTDDNGLFGIERFYDRHLKGSLSNISRSKDGHGNAIFLNRDEAIPEKSGHNIILTIDRAIQEITAQALVQGIKKAGAKGGHAIVSDPHTGKIIAIANYPTFNPNKKEKLKLSHTKNQAIANLYEPGSVIKPLVVAIALDEQSITTQESFFCEKGYYQIDRTKIHDSHKHEHLTPSEIISQSSNIGIFKIATRLGKSKLFSGLVKFGISDRNLHFFPTEQASGKLLTPDRWNLTKFANISFGQGFATTGIEITQAFNTIANGGLLMKPYVIDRIETAEGKVIAFTKSSIIHRTLHPKTADIVKGFLEQTVKKGTGTQAAPSDYSAAGKTGTTEKYDPQIGAYSLTKRIASFIGFTPVDDPVLTIYVVIDEPGKKPYYGGIWAAPVFKEIAEKSLDYLNIAHDKRTEISATPGLLEKPPL